MHLQKKKEGCFFVFFGHFARLSLSFGFFKKAARVEEKLLVSFSKSK